MSKLSIERQPDGLSLFTQGALADLAPGAMHPVGHATAIEAVIGG